MEQFQGYLGENARNGRRCSHPGMTRASGEVAAGARGAGGAHQMQIPSAAREAPRPRSAPSTERCGPAQGEGGQTFPLTMVLEGSRVSVFRLIIFHVV